MPAIRPTAMEAPMFSQVPAMGPYMMPPARVPIIDPLISTPFFLPTMIEKAQQKITLALIAKNTEIQASGQAYVRTGSSLASSLATECLTGQRVLVVQKARKRKKLPSRVRTLEFLDLQSESEVFGFLRKRLTMAEQTAEKRQTEVIWQSSKKRLSGEESTSRLQRKWLRFHTKLKRKELMTRWEKLIRPYKASRATS